MTAVLIGTQLAVPMAVALLGFVGTELLQKMQLPGIFLTKIISVLPQMQEQSKIFPTSSLGPYGGTFQPSQRFVIMSR